MVVSCEHVWQEISNYLEGDVDAPLRSAMDEHFLTCAHCKSVLEGTRNVIQLYSDERMIEVPAGFGRRLEKRLIQNSRVSGSRWSSWSAWLVPVAALALATAGLRLANSMTFSPPIKSELAQPAKDIPPDMVVLVAAGTRVFHVAGCGVIHNKDHVRTLTAKEAIREGYVPCIRCLRKYVENASAGHFALDSEAAADLDDDEDGHGGQ